MQKAPYGINGFRAVRALEAAARDPRIVEIEGLGMDPGEVFLHLEGGGAWSFNDGCGVQRTKSVRCAADVRHALSIIVPVESVDPY